MIERIKKYKRYKDYYTLSSFEVKWSICITVVTIVFLNCVLDFYQRFFSYCEGLKQIIMVMTGGEFTLLGMSLAGIAIVVALFSSEELKILEKVDKNDAINRVLSQFEFSAMNLSLQIIYLLIIYLILFNTKPVVAFWIFWGIIGLVMYHFCFNILYIVVLVGACIKLSSIKNKCNKIFQNDYSTIDMANEIRIEYLIKMILSNEGINRDKFLKDLFTMLDESQVKNKEEIKNYLKHHYGL